MILLDVNLLVYAHREDAEDHERYADWLRGILTGAEPFGLSDLVLSAFVRIVTHLRIFEKPTPLETAIAFTEALRSRPNRVQVEPGPRHWEIFLDLCRRTRLRGGAVSDAWLAALAIESGSEWVTADRGFARFPGLRWRHPFDELVVRERTLRYRRSRAAGARPPAKS